MKWSIVVHINLWLGVIGGVSILVFEPSVLPGLVPVALGAFVVGRQTVIDEWDEWIKANRDG